MKKLTTEKFIEKANKIHNNKYNYSLSVHINTKTKVTIICPKHGIFEQTSNIHLSGCGCPKCGIEKGIRTHLSNKNEFIEKANKIHKNKYDYSLSNYIHSKIKIKIICLKHDVFEQKPNAHLRGDGCPKCRGRVETIGEFIDKANIIHNFKFDYSLSNYIKSCFKIKIICPKHGIFEQTPHEHLTGRGCPRCRASKGEMKIENFLKINNIKYEIQKTFNNCRNMRTNGLLRFDFYLSDKNLLIEYDGQQHYNNNNIFINKRDNTLKIRDAIKNEFCLENNIKLIRIPYWKFPQIEQILTRNLLT